LAMQLLLNGSPTSDEAVYSDTANTGNCFRYDTTSSQFIFNLGTKPYTRNTTNQLIATIPSGNLAPGQGMVVIGLK